ncbi:hypothetical protein [Xanthomonas phaseoli]|uniref:hypothetical protein n=1 Tax=Xanthomonas phaseoli TaxID=1985254 RepID=UPI0002E16F51|nr:hypothetical protein [Xanthomonas phaseoli]
MILLCDLLHYRHAIKSGSGRVLWCLKPLCEGPTTVQVGRQSQMTPQQRLHCLSACAGGGTMTRT